MNDESERREDAAPSRRSLLSARSPFPLGSAITTLSRGNRVLLIPSSAGAKTVPLHCRCVADTRLLPLLLYPGRCNSIGPWVRNTAVTFSTAIPITQRRVTIEIGSTSTRSPINLLPFVEGIERAQSDL